MKEAALDSPTFRSGFTHFTEQLELVERWLENYVRAITRVSHEVGSFEAVINGYLSQSIPPSHVSEAVLDHDYTLLAMKRYGEGAKEFWTAAITGLKKMEMNMVDPIRSFLQNDLRAFKETRKSVDQSQKQLDSLLSRFSAQAKSKEASSLREDAFQVHEARKTYLKASMDFSVMAPQVRMSLDKMLVKMFADQWRDTRSLRQMGSLERWTGDIERVRGWSREMEYGERTFRRELQTARKQIEESAEAAIRPSRELDDYSIDALSKSRGPSLANIPTPGPRNRPVRAEKQGWLNLRTVSGKPSRTIWLRRWFYVKSGIFGWLIQGSRSGAVEESDRIGVLLCSVRASNSDDRRYVFEVKTKDTTIILQAETLPELNEWLTTFDVAKQKALEDSSSTEGPVSESRAQDPAFAISPPSAPEFAANAMDSGMPQSGDDASTGLSVDRSMTLPVPGADPAIARSSFDISSPKKSAFEREGEGTREKFISKLDLHRKPLGSGPGGIASLIAASHGSMPVGPGVLPPPTLENPTSRKLSTAIPSVRDLPSSTLAPNTLANPPAPTNLSATAVIVNGERGIGMHRADASEGLPSGLMANVWGSWNWGFLNRLERGELNAANSAGSKPSNPPSPLPRPIGTVEATTDTPENSVPAILGTSPSHRKTVSLDRDVNLPTSNTTTNPVYPNDYPLQLKTQDAQFRLLFPGTSRDERVTLVFKASWNPNDQQDFPGRIYVTTKEVYFYSNHCGMTMTTSISLDSISDVTAAGGRECDFLYLHLKTASSSGFTRITIKTFLEPLKLLQRRLGFLVSNAMKEESTLEDVMKALIKMDQDEPGSSPSGDSWENVSINTPTDDTSFLPKKSSIRDQRDQRDLRANVLIDRGLYNDSRNVDSIGQGLSKSFKLPKQPVVFIPRGMDQLAVEKEFEISPKALYHVLFGDKSAVWQLLYHERHAQRIRMGPWIQPEQGHLRREFEYEIEYLNILRQVRKASIRDHQVVDSANEHLLYVVSDKKTPWHLPYRNDFSLLTKVIITHVAKSRCKLALYIKVDWSKPHFAQSIIRRRALYDLYQDALDLADVVSDQCRRLGEKSRTKKAITVFGQVGLQTQVSEFAGSDSPLSAQLRRSMKPRTLTSLVFESCASMAESVLTSAFQVLFRILGWIWKTFNANGIILCILACSIIVNLTLSTRNVTDSWRERRAANFMARLGIGPDLTMVKSIHLHDLAEASGDLTMYSTNSHEDGEGEGIEAEVSKCRDTFNEIMHLQIPSNAFSSSAAQADLDLSAPSSSSPSKTAQQHRIQCTRQDLGSRRHDLLVGLRVVNSVEREMLRAEWETWLMNESAKCQQIGNWIRRMEHERSTKDSSDTATANRGGDVQSEGKMNRTTSPERLEQIRSWFEDHCHSCIREREVSGI